MNIFQFKRILSNYLEHKASLSEKKAIEKFEKFYYIKNSARKFSEKDYNTIEKTIEKNIFKHIAPQKKKFTLLKYAAIFAISMGSIFYVFKDNFISNEISYANNSNLPKSYTLKDGTIITLNKNASITFEDSFNDKNRSVELTGEAFFKVAKNKNLPFIIETGKLKTQVLGTQFNLNATGLDFVVSVTEGKVKVFNKKDTLHLVKNQQAIYHTKKELFEQHYENSSLYTLWSNEWIELNKIKTKDLKIVFKELYNIDFVLEDQKILDKELSLSFNKNKSVENLIDEINLITELKLIKKGSMITVK